MADGERQEAVAVEIGAVLLFGVITAAAVIFVELVAYWTFGLTSPGWREIGRGVLGVTGLLWIVWAIGRLRQVDARHPRRGRDPDDTWYAAVAYVRDGRFAALAAVLAVLHSRGAVVAGRKGTVRRPEDRPAPKLTGLEAVVLRGLHGARSPGDLVAEPSVDAALGDLRCRCRRLALIRSGLPIRAWLPVHTRTGRRLLRAASRDCPWPPPPMHPEVPVEDSVGMPVALYGNQALMALMPGFARDSGLLTHESFSYGTGLQNPSGFPTGG